MFAKLKKECEEARNGTSVDRLNSLMGVCCKLQVLKVELVEMEVD